MFTHQGRQQRLTQRGAEWLSRAKERCDNHDGKNAQGTLRQRRAFCSEVGQEIKLWKLCYFHIKRDPEGTEFGDAQITSVIKLIHHDQVSLCLSFQEAQDPFLF